MIMREYRACKRRRHAQQRYRNGKRPHDNYRTHLISPFCERHWALQLLAADVAVDFANAAKILFRNVQRCGTAGLSARCRVFSEALVAVALEP
jgi:hypothetical protein